MTDGAFDITVAPILVARGHLPCPALAPEPDGAAIWRDIELLPDNRIRFRRPLWIDLGGIAKGYAVDRAMAALQRFAPVQACVNAGGDLRIAGPDSERVRLAADHGAGDRVPVIELADGSLASSAGSPAARISIRAGASATARQFVSVVAPRCIDADALTKVVMARGACSARSLAAFAARAVDPRCRAWMARNRRARLMHMPVRPYEPVRLKRSRRWLTYGIGLGLWLTGAAWLVFHYFLKTPSLFGPAENPLTHWWLAAHGLFAFAITVAVRPALGPAHRRGVEDRAPSPHRAA